jgi:hypothetical protein
MLDRVETRIIEVKLDPTNTSAIANKKYPRHSLEQNTLNVNHATATGATKS